MELESHLFFLCTQVVYRRQRALQKALKPIGLSATEFRILSAALRKGPLSVRDMAEWTAFERTRLTHSLDGLEARGWVARNYAADDKRSVLVRITPAGKAIFERAKRIVDDVTDRIMGDVPSSQVTQLRHALQTMRDKLIEMGD
ncbi:MarR family winged helix-turn-helix transcriptional regulator [Solimonas marina]|nr:MarR family transcriptional regulator [Solimonas marina]